MMTRWIVLVVAVATSGCIGQTDPGHADWYGDARFTTEERAAIVTGEAWIAAHAGRVPATFDWSYDVTVPIEGHEAHTIRRDSFGGAAGECLGFTPYEGRGAHMFIDPTAADPRDLPGLVAHEMAHCELGFVDGYRASDARSDGIMRVLYPMRWTASEDAQLSAVR